MYKKYLRVLMILLLVTLMCPIMSKAYAASSDTVAIKVTVTPALSVSITENTLALGSVVAGSATVSAAALTVTNDGSGVNETYSLSVANPSGWTASQTAAGSETYVLNAAFSNLVTGITWGEANDALSTAPVVSTTTRFAGDQTGAAVPRSAVRKLWFQFKAPTATTVSAEQSIVLTVTAQAS